jgi:hypothetical protein
VYFVSDVLMGSKKYYSKIGKIAMRWWWVSESFIIISRLQTIWLLINQSLNDIFGNRDSLGQISKRSMVLSEHEVDFKKISAIKSQNIANFIAEWMKPSSYTEAQCLNLHGWYIGMEPREVPELEQWPYWSHPLVRNLDTHQHCNSPKRQISAQM